MLKHVMKSWYAHNSNYKEWEVKVLKYMNKEEFEDLMFFLKDLYNREIGIDSYVLKFDSLAAKVQKG